MFCCKCGIEMPEHTKFCSECGTSTGKGWKPNGTVGPAERLSRPIYDKKIAGVCAGFARYFNVDVTLVRVLAIVFALWPMPGVGIVAYFVAWIVMPRDPLALPEPAQAQNG